ncbi:unnamed protein product [Mytilus edulis]|uniref:EGF-like domain-containing protein n=1 Tax=Mytilus edulis TaxID=6550 RepID=A0A8S3UMU6_MYTED|nr:unnamed protein product [Mytilus edulis]
MRLQSKREINIECCPDYIYQNRKCEACMPGKYGQGCSETCLPNYYGRQCKNECNCRGNTKCDPIYGCICYAGFTGTHCLDVCNDIYYDYNYNGVYNCSETCECTKGAICNKQSGICQCTNSSEIFHSICNSLCVCVPLVLLTSLVLLWHWKYRRQQRGQNNDQRHYHEINLYSEIREDELQDITATRTDITGDDLHTENRFQLINREYENQNNAQSLPNIHMLEEQYLNPYCSLQYANDDYLNPYCALSIQVVWTPSSIIKRELTSVKEKLSTVQKKGESKTAEILKLREQLLHFQSVSVENEKLRADVLSLQDNQQDNPLMRTTVRFT